MTRFEWTVATSLFLIVLLGILAVSCMPSEEVIGSDSSQGTSQACERLSKTHLHYWYRCVDKENHFLCYLYGDVMKCFDISITRQENEMSEIKQRLLDEYSESVGGDDYMTIEGFLNFLVEKIEALEIQPTNQKNK